MARVAQTFTVRVSEAEDFGGYTVANFDDVRKRALSKVGMTPHRKYFGRIRRIRNDQKRSKAGLRSWRFTIVRP